MALGVTYHEIDDYLEGKEVSAKAQETIETWWRKGQHKRHLPITILMILEIIREMIYD